MFLLLTIAPGIFGQVYSWMSGFQNYVPPLLLLLLTLLLIRKSGRGGLLTKIRQGLLVFLLTLFVMIVSCKTDLPVWGCICNTLVFMLAMLPTKLPAKGNIAGALMYLGLLFLI